VVMSMDDRPTFMFGWIILMSWQKQQGSHITTLCLGSSWKYSVSHSGKDRSS
jgi:hypothetical protein